MHSENETIDKNQMIKRALILLLITGGAAILGKSVDLTEKQILASSIFMMIIASTLLFWSFRLAIAFVGIGALMGCRVISVGDFVHDSELPIILFLVGMMVTVGVLKELGLFTWIIQTVLGLKGMTGTRFIVVLVYLSAFLACAVDEVTSIVFAATLIFQVCDTLKVRPTPFLMISIMATNIGSAGTMLGNPVGILIGRKAGFHFMDFIYWSFPVMLVALTSTLVLLLFWFQKEIGLLDERLRERRNMGLTLGPLVAVPYGRSLAILIGMITFIALHHNLEAWLQLEPNTILIVAPLVVSGFLMMWRHQRARHYIESEVEWWTLMFFMMLFAVAGSLKHSGVTTRIAEDFTVAFADHPGLLPPVIILTSALGSAFVDNIVFVAAFIPVVEELHQTPLWWALLYGACFGGNITMIGSTANIVALGMLEKRYRINIRFFEWLKIGLAVGTLSGLIAWGGLSLLSKHMPERAERIAKTVLTPKSVH